MCSGATTLRQCACQRGAQSQRRTARNEPCTLHREATKRVTGHVFCVPPILTWGEGVVCWFRLWCILYSTHSEPYRHFYKSLHYPPRPDIPPQSADSDTGPDTDNLGIFFSRLSSALPIFKENVILFSSSNNRYFVCKVLLFFIFQSTDYF